MPLEEDWTEIEVFADRLQVAGDPRGELLALELASERATNSEDARRLNREAQRIRDAHRELVWPTVLGPTGTKMRAGFVVSADHDEITEHAIPLELLLSLRGISVRQPLESCAALLEEGWRRGLRLEHLGHWGNPEDGPAQLDSLRRFIEYDALAPALETVYFSNPVHEVELLAKLPKLRSCIFDAPLSEAELRSLAPLRLGTLQLRDQLVPASLAEWFGDTLTHLHLAGCEGSLAPLSGLSRLEMLNLEGEELADAIVELQGLTQLEDLKLPRLDGRGLAVLSHLNLRSLLIREMSPALVRQLAKLQTLESLTILRTEGSLDVSAFAELPRLRRLSVPGPLIGELQLPPGFKKLSISGTSGLVPITGEVAELSVLDFDLRELPSSLLGSARQLFMMCLEDPQYDALAELPRLMPQLEIFSLSSLRNRPWSEAPEVLGALPRLRAIDLLDDSVEALAERARTFPDLCVLGSEWPRSCGPL